MQKQAERSAQDGTFGVVYPEETVLKVNSEYFKLADKKSLLMETDEWWYL